MADHLDREQAGGADSQLDQLLADLRTLARQASLAEDCRNRPLSATASSRRSPSRRAISSASRAAAPACGPGSARRSMAIVASSRALSASCPAGSAVSARSAAATRWAERSSSSLVVHTAGMS
ncbi:hypothetical protein [Geodermatophilus sp. FMUSA9-8]|uniref:hypothetical protein n=1 Tax=Geodermatophilus sp. FMUSA9-8 TaxID=3120155 RepID=UPI0030093E5B